MRPHPQKTRRPRPSSPSVRPSQLDPLIFEGVSEYGGSSRWPAGSLSPGTQQFPKDMTGPLSYGPNGDEKRPGTQSSTGLTEPIVLAYTRH